MFSDYVNRLHAEVSASLASAERCFDHAIAKAEAMQFPLSLPDLAALAKAAAPKDRGRVLAAAKKSTRLKHGTKIGFIAPLYIDNHCDNACRYCGMSRYNKHLERVRIDAESDFVEEISLLRMFGYYTVELVAGGCRLDMGKVAAFLQIMETLDVENSAFFFDTLSEDRYEVIGEASPEVTMIHWQETYMRERYAKFHPPDTAKGDYAGRLNAIETALKAGIKKYGIGVLFGLSNPCEDVLMCIGHGRYLHDKHGTGPRAIGIVRLQPTEGAEIVSMPVPVDEATHLFMSAVLRLAFPEAEMIATTRETRPHVEKLLCTAATFTNATCTTVPMGYSAKLREGLQTDGQFFHESPSFPSAKRMIRKLGLDPDPHRQL